MNHDGILNRATLCFCIICEFDQLLFRRVFYPLSY